MPELTDEEIIAEIINLKLFVAAVKPGIRIKYAAEENMASNAQICVQTVMILKNALK